MRSSASFHECPWPPPTDALRHARLVGGPGNNRIVSLDGAYGIHVGDGFRLHQYAWRQRPVNGEIIGVYRGSFPEEDPLGWRHTRGRLLR